MAKAKIPGGYYIKARCIQNSEIAIAPPYVREVWDWLLKEANHMDQKIHGKLIKRGQMFRTFKDIKEGLHWKVGYRKMTYKKWQIEKAMKFLRERTMIATMKATRGIFITIINYDFYQTPANYNGQREQQREQRSADTKNNNGKKKELIKEKIYRKEKVEMTETEYNKLVEKLGANLTNQYIEDLNLYMLSHGKRYKSHYATVLAWYRKDEREGRLRLPAEKHMSFEEKVLSDTR
jgi:hypothetical protein